MYKWYKRLVYTHPDLLARFCKVNLSNAKNSAWFLFQAWLIYGDQEPLWLIKCDRRWLLFYGCTYEAINSMQDLVHSWAVCKLFFSKITYASVNSTCAQPPPLPGLLRGICTPRQSQGWGICKFCTAWGRASANPGAIPEVLTHTRFWRGL